MNATQVAVTLRRTRADDAAALTTLLAGLSVASAHFRFLTGLGVPSARLVARLLHRDATHGAWLAMAGDAAVGHVMWALDDDAVELGAVVTDVWQRRGIGRWLVQSALAEAAVAGATAVHLDVHVENHRVVAMLRRALPGAVVTREAEMLTYRAPMTSAMATRPAPPRPEKGLDLSLFSDYRQRDGNGRGDGLAGSTVQPHRHPAGGSAERPVPGPGPLPRRGAAAVGDRQ